MESTKDWKPIKPTESSYRTGLKVNNTLSLGELVEFIPKQGKKVTWYMCGPTVYDFSHLGHARTYIGFDMIKKIMKNYLGYDIQLVMNITNIDDKIIKRSNEAGEKFEDFAIKWENDYFEDMKTLGVELPDVITRVSEYVPEVVFFIEEIIKKGYGYESNGSVYFDVTKYKQETGRYGKLKNLGDEKEITELIKEGEGALTGDEKEKKSPLDFALWKKSKQGEPKWDSPWGEGRPGWHIECSAMANAILGTPLDIHSGGVDLRFPHHENEIAQSEAFYNTEQWINYFIHTGHLNIDGLKMSKSLKNFITIKSMTKRYSARQIRLLFATRRYDTVMDYHPTAEELGVPQSEVQGAGSMAAIALLDKRFQEFFISVKSALRDNPITKPQKWAKAEFDLNNLFTDIKVAVHAHILDNFNVPEAIKSIDDLITATNKYINAEAPKYPLLFAISTYVSTTFRTFGLAYDDKISSSGEDDSKVNVEDIVSPYVGVLRDFRDEVRTAARAKDTGLILQKCDEIRDDILPNLGVRLEDKGAGKAIWKFDDKEKLLEEKKKREEDKKKSQEEAKKKEEDKQKKAEAAAKKVAELAERSKIEPKEYFKRQANLYSQFDEEGVPTHDKEGVELSKSKKKDLKKEFNEQKSLYENYLKGEKKE